MADISVIIPTYNRLWSLPQAVDSCWSASLAVEVIVIDDGSTDGTWEWLQSQKAIRAFRQENLGKDWAVNLGFKNASAEYIRFLDSDDMIAPGANEMQLRAARVSGADVVAAGYVSLDERKNERHEVEWTSCDDFLAQQLGECDSSHYSAYLFRRDFISSIPHRQEYGAVDDRMFVVEVAMHEPRVTYVREPCLIHRQHDGERLQAHKGLGRAVSHWQLLKIYERCARVMSQKGALTERRAHAMAQSLWPLAHRIAYVDRDEATRVAAWVQDLSPLFSPPESGFLGRMYRVLGFRATERVLAIRREMLRLARGQ